MPRFEVKQSAKLNLTSYSGLALIGQCCQAAQVEAVIDPRLPVSQGMRRSDLVKSVVGLLSLGKSDFEAIEPFRGDRFFKEALGLAKVPGSVWMRQRLDARAAELRELTDELSLRLLERTEAPITAHKGYVCADLDTFVMDNSDTKKEAVSRTYQGVDGYTPIALYLGNEGWNLGLELRAGSHHSALETEYFFERAFPRLRRVCAADAKLLWRADSGFDSARLLFALADERDRWAALGRSFDYLTKWNPRRQDKAGWGGLCVYDPDKCGKNAPPRCKYCEELDSSGECPTCKFKNDPDKDRPDGNPRIFGFDASKTGLGEFITGALKKLPVHDAFTKQKFKVDGSASPRERCCESLGDVTHYERFEVGPLVEIATPDIPLPGYSFVYPGLVEIGLFVKAKVTAGGTIRFDYSRNCSPIFSNGSGQVVMFPAVEGILKA